MIGDVRINGVPPVGELPFVPICAGDLVTVGTRLARRHLLAQRRHAGAARPGHGGPHRDAGEPDSGLVALTRGAIYF